MSEKKYESTFIPCGDALEKMELFAGDAPEEEANKLDVSLQSLPLEGKVDRM